MSAATFTLVAEGPQDATVLVVGDVVGHGLAAARRAAFTRATFAATASLSDDPCRLLDWANLALIERPSDAFDYRPLRMCPTPSSAGPLGLELPATPTSVTTARHAVAEFCNGHALDRGAVALAVTEAVANAVVHAYRDGDPGLVYVAASLDDGTLAVVISDDGHGMAPRTDSPGLGLGLALIANLTDSLQIEHDGGGTRLIMRFGPRR